MKSTVFVLASMFVASALPVAGAGTWTTSSWNGGFCFSVYRNKAYFLNMDTRRARTFDYILDGKSGTMTLNPCEIRTLPR